MVDIPSSGLPADLGLPVHLDVHGERAERAPRRAAPAAGSGRDRAPRPPRSDVGTIVLHWTMTIAMIVSVLTGLRIAADNEFSIFAKSLSGALPQGEIWTPHIISALVVIVCVFAYAIYLSRSGLDRRISWKRTIALTLETSAKLTWGAVNVVLHWILFAAVLVLLGTGVVLYLGHGGWWVTAHYVACLVTLAYAAAHLFAHFMYGGLSQWLRLFRPAALVKSPALGERPLTIAAAVGLAVAAGAAGVDSLTRETLAVPAIAAADAPRIDGVLDDAAWSRARAVVVHTQQGANLAGTGASDVEIRAVHDDKTIYFAFRWWDPTRSIKRLPLVKQADGWHMMHNKADIADETAHYEDKFAVLFSETAEFGAGGSTHLGPKPLADFPPALNKRGQHYTTDGSLKDMWQWKASRGGMLGMMDDMWFAAPVKPTQDQIDGKIRYQAGYDGDKGRTFYSYNFVIEPPGGFRGPIQVKRLPKDYRATVAKLGRIDFADDASDDEGSQWWMFEDESVPYSAEADAGIPVGTVIPAVLIMGQYEGGRADVHASAKWRDQHWTLEVTRALETGHEQDLVMRSGLYLWVSVFDHTQTRHTRHMRPVEMQIR